MIVPDKDKRIIRFIFSEANFCLGSNPFPEKKDEKIFFFERYDDGSVDSSWGLSLYISTPLLRNGCFFGFSPIASLHPAMLRGTARGGV